MKESRRGILAFIGVIVLIGLVAILLLVQMDRPGGETDRIPVEERSTAQELAIFSAGEYVAEDDPRVANFEDLLEGIASNVTETRKEIGDLSTEAVIDLREEEDVEVTLQDYLERAESLASDMGPEASYEEVVSRLEVIFSEEETEA